MNDYIEATFRANPPFAATAGRHEFDGQLPDWSEAGIENEVARLKSAVAAAEKFDPAKLTENERFERAYLIAQAKGTLFFIDAADQAHKNPAYYNGSLDPSTYVVVPYAAPEVRLKAYTRYLEAIPAAVQHIRENLRMPLPVSFVDYGKNAFGGYADYYPSDGLKAFAGVGTAQEQTALKTASTNAAAAMRSLANWLEEQRPKANNDFALGAAKFQQMLYDTEMVDTPIAELEKIGRADLDSNLKLLTEACGRWAAGMTIMQCMEKMNANKPEGGPVAAARAQLAGLKQFILDKDLVTIPGPEEAKVEEAPPYNRQNFAYINIPGPYEKNLPSVYYIAPPDPTWPKAVQDGFVPGKADLLFTSVHEVWPGHFLNFLHSNRVAVHLRQGVRRLRVRGRLGPLWRRDDARRGRRRRHRRDHDRAIVERAAAQLPLPVGDRHAHRPDDAGAELSDCSATNASRTRATPASRRLAGPTTRPISITRWAS